MSVALWNMTTGMPFCRLKKVIDSNFLIAAVLKSGKPSDWLLGQLALNEQMYWCQALRLLMGWSRYTVEPPPPPPKPARYKTSSLIQTPRMHFHDQIRESWPLGVPLIAGFWSKLRYSYYVIP